MQFNVHPCPWVLTRNAILPTRDQLLQHRRQDGLALAKLLRVIAPEAEGAGEIGSMCLHERYVFMAKGCLLVILAVGGGHRS